MKVGKGTLYLSLCFILLSAVTTGSISFFAKFPIVTIYVFRSYKLLTFAISNHLGLLCMPQSTFLLDLFCVSTQVKFFLTSKMFTKKFYLWENFAKIKKL